jgi:hypothetical protein
MNHLCIEDWVFDACKVANKSYEDNILSKYEYEIATHFLINRDMDGFYRYLDGLGVKIK